MSSWTTLFTSPEVGEIAAGSHATLAVTGDRSMPASTVSPEALSVAQALLIQLPEVTFTFEVDVVGRHRITVHFGGGSIAVDE